MCALKLWWGWPCVILYSSRVSILVLAIWICTCPWCPDELLIAHVSIFWVPNVCSTMVGINASEAKNLLPGYLTTSWIKQSQNVNQNSTHGNYKMWRNRRVLVYVCLFVSAYAWIIEIIGLSKPKSSANAVALFRWTIENDLSPVCLRYSGIWIMSNFFSICYQVLLTNYRHFPSINC